MPLKRSTKRGWFAFLRALLLVGFAVSLIIYYSMISLPDIMSAISETQISHDVLKTALSVGMGTSLDYDAIYDSFGTHGSYMDRRLFNFTSFYNYTSPRVLNNGCNLTVIIVDPRPPISSYNHPIWFSLESLALFVPYACITLHTASCKTVNQGSKQPTSSQRVEVTAKSMYERSLPMFRRMMEMGQVRINVIDHIKYGLTDCDNFGKGNNVFMNVHFWQDEFINGLDSDMVMTFQDDGVLCRYFDIHLWKDFAYVGAPWVPGWFWTNKIGGAGCDSMRDIWSEWAPKCNGLTEYQANESSSRFCTPGYGGLQGNGGVSLRNRRWMVEVIQRCPSELSGLEMFDSNEGAYTFDSNEDVYFATILNGLNATMPTAFEASLFSVENLFPEDILEKYELVDRHEVVAKIERLWGRDTGMEAYERMHRNDSYDFGAESATKLRTIPFAFHQVWLHTNVNDVQIQNECKLLKFVVR